MAGERGRKAFAVQLLSDDKPSAVPAPRPPSPLPAPVRVPAPVTTHAAASDAVAPAAAASPDDDEQTCDVLSPDEFRQELTELLPDNVPALTGQQITGIRTTLLESARKHGWIDI